MNNFHHICCQCQKSIDFLKAFWVFLFLSLVDLFFMSGDNNNINFNNSAIVDRRFLTPLFYEDPPILPTPPFLNLFHLTPLPSALLLLLILLPCCFSWMVDHDTFDMLFYLMIFWIYTCWAFAELNNVFAFYKLFSSRSHISVY